MNEYDDPATGFTGEWPPADGQHRLVVPELGEVPIGVADDVDGYVGASEAVEPEDDRFAPASELGIDEYLIVDGNTVADKVLPDEHQDAIFTPNELAGLQGDVDEQIGDAYRNIGLDPDVEHMQVRPAPPSVTFIPVRDTEGNMAPQCRPDQDPPAKGSGLDALVEQFVQRNQMERDQTHFDTEVPLTPAEEEVFADIVAGYGRLAEQLGVPEARGRITDKAHLHVFETQSDFAEAAVSIGSDPETADDSTGTSGPSIGVMWTRSANPVDNATGIAHEVAHDMGVVNIVVMPDDYSEADDAWVVEIRTGHLDNARGLNELTVGMLADRVVRPLIGDSAMVYTGLDAIGDAAIREVAQGQNPQFVEDQLERGYLNGETTAKEWIVGVLGEGHADMLFAMTGDETLPEALEIAREMGLPTAVRMIQDMIDKRPVRLFAWR